MQAAGVTPNVVMMRELYVTTSGRQWCVGCGGGYSKHRGHRIIRTHTATGRCEPCKSPTARQLSEQCTASTAIERTQGRTCQ